MGFFGVYIFPKWLKKVPGHFGILFGWFWELKNSLNLGPIIGHFWSLEPRIYGFSYTKIPQQILESIWEHPGKYYFYIYDTQKIENFGTYPHSHIAT